MDLPQVRNVNSTGAKSERKFLTSLKLLEVKDLGTLYFAVVGIDNLSLSIL